MRPHFKLLLMIFSAIFFNSGLSLAKTVEEKDFLFAPDETSLMEKNIHVAVDFPHSTRIKEKYPTVQGLDFPKLFESTSSKFMVGRYMYLAPQDVSFFGNEHMLTEKGFLLLSKKTKVSNFKLVSPNKAELEIEKDVALCSVSAKADFSIYDRDQIEDLPFASSLLESVSPYRPEYLTIQHSHDFSKFFRHSVHMCTFGPFKEGQTLVICLAFGAMELSSYNRTSWLVDLEKKFKDELLFFANNVLNYNPEPNSSKD